MPWWWFSQTIVEVWTWMGDYILYENNSCNKQSKSFKFGHGWVIISYMKTIGVISNPNRLSLDMDE